MPHPSSLLRQPSSRIPQPSSLIPHPSSLIPHPSSLIPHPSSLIPYPSSLMNPRPKLSQATRPLTFEVQAPSERGEVLPTAIAGEPPLTLYVDKREIVTLMTLGQAPEALAIGYLRNQRLVKSIEEIEAVQVDWET